MTTIIRRHLWNISKSKSVGFIESIYKSGYFIHAEYISLRITSSNLSTGNNIELNLHKLPHQDASELENILSRKIPVYVESSIDFLGSPLKGDIFGEHNALRIMPLSEEVIHNKQINV